MRIIKEMKLSNGYATADALGSDTVRGVEGSYITISSVDSLLGNTYTLEASSSNNEGNTKNMTSPSTMLPNLSEESRGTNTSHHIVPFSSPEAINIQDIMNKSARGKILLQLFQRPDSNSISRKYVNELVRICVHSMVTDLETLYPTSIQKKNLAKAIVSAFPILKSSRDNVEGYRLKTLRIKLSPSPKKNRRRVPATVTESIALEFEEDESSIASKITWLQYQVPSSLHKAEILETMKETFRYRRNYISNHNPSMLEVLKAYPKFKDFGGLLIDAEFKEMYPNVDDFLAIFPTQYAPRILKYARENRTDIYLRFSVDGDENFRALLMVADLLPVPGYRKKRKDSGQSLAPLFPSDSLIRFIGINGCLEEVVGIIQEKQPYILCVGEEDAPEIFFLILDKEFVNLHYGVKKSRFERLWLAGSKEITTERLQHAKMFHNDPPRLLLKKPHHFE
ncbi:hypothetical protein JTE90_013349 [Oedothorax gibbosus]|uniref:Uncharacterized protein n=1 Tax=Oedothorax gibbosus TaxID=931172 RepID=A0AAV6TVW4_9ARAC|nr:hypothetical protein JTE90_013349 [Oedothorax gibbosus]